MLPTVGGEEGETKSWSVAAGGEPIAKGQRGLRALTLQRSGGGRKGNSFPALGLGLLDTSERTGSYSAYSL